MATFHQASRLGLEGKSLGLSLLDGGSGGKGIFWTWICGDFQIWEVLIIARVSQTSIKIKNNIDIWKENNVKFYQIKKK